MYAPRSNPRAHAAHLVDDDRFTVRIPAAPAKAISASLEKAYDLVPDTGSTMIQGLGLEEAELVEARLRSAGMDPSIEAVPVAPGTRQCFRHPERPNQARCIRCYRFSCGDCFSFVEDWPVCCDCTGGQKVVDSRPPWKEPASVPEIAAALAGSLVVAACGGIAWGWIANVTGYEFQILEQSRHAVRVISPALSHYFSDP